MTAAAFAAAIKRWHFYAGLVVAPVFLVSALTGVVMALNAPIERLLYADLKFVPVSGAASSPGKQLATVMIAYPGETPVTYVPPAAAGRAAEFILTRTTHGTTTGGHGPAGERSVFVDPYRTRITGSIDPATTPYGIARKIHGALLLGEFGEYMVEIAAGFGVVLALSGLLLWLTERARGVVAAGADRTGRAAWKARHLATGPLLFLPLLFFLLSGLAWTPVWGGKIVQAWGMFPAARLAAPRSDQTHASMDHGDHRQAPWALSATPMPLSTANTRPPMTLDDAVARAADLGVKRSRINFPDGEAGVWTISATTISGDISDPRAERTVHLDQYTGAVIADIGFAEYSLGGKAMAAGIPLHQAGLGAWNVAVNLLFCAAVIIMIVSAAAMALARRGRRGGGISAPGGAATTKMALGGAAATVFVSLLFPLTAAALVVIVAADTLAARRKQSAFP